MSSLSNRLQANKRFDFSSSAFAADKFAVVTMEGDESISRTFRFTLTLVSDDAGIDFDTMLRNPATLTLYAPEGGAAVPYHGVLAGFEQLHRSDGYVFYRAVLVPRLWRLSLYRISEVYLNEQSITAIIEGVLKGARLPASAFELKLMGDYRTRSFVCQYQETHLDFLSRWMEKEGMYYWFDHDGTEDKLIIGDHRTMHAVDAIKLNYRPADELDTGVAADAVQGFVCRQKPLPYQVILQDFNHRKAALELKVSEVVAEQGLGDVMIYGENFRNEQEGRRYARLRAEEIACGGRVFSGESTAVGVRSGYFMDLSHHYRADFNGKYLVTAIHHEGSQAGALLEGIRSPYSQQGAGGETAYRNSFTAIAAAVQFRAERVTAKPRVAGTMNATIDGEGSGEYAELDEYGQYKVQLPFDQSHKKASKGSARVRMATPYAGSGHGMHFPLHKNAEVLLSFVDGDPDQPVILGAVPNSENPNIVNQDNHVDNGISTKGGNQLYMGDAKGKEVMWMHSPYHNTSIGIGSIDPQGGGSLAFLTAGSSEAITVGNSYELSVGAKTDVSVAVETSLAASMKTEVSVGASFGVECTGGVTWTLPGSRSLTVDDSEDVSLSNSTSQTANNELVFSAGQNFDVAAEKLALDGLKKSIRVATGVVIAANVAISASAMGVLAGKAGDKDLTTEDRAASNKADAEQLAKREAELRAEGKSEEDAKAIAKAEADEQESYTPEAGTQPFGKGDGTKWAIGASAMNFGLNALTTTGTFLYLRRAFSKLGVLYAAQRHVSNIKMDKTGIGLRADVLGAHSAMLDLDGTGFELKSGLMPPFPPVVPPAPPPPDPPPLPPLASVSGKAGTVAISGDIKVEITGTTGVDVSSGLNTFKLDPNHGELAVGTNSLMISATRAKLDVAGNGVVATQQATTLRYGGAGVQATAAGLKLSMGGAAAQFTPAMVSLEGPLLKLG